MLNEYNIKMKILTKFSHIFLLYTCLLLPPPPPHLNNWSLTDHESLGCLGHCCGTCKLINWMSTFFFSHFFFWRFLYLSLQLHTRSELERAYIVIKRLQCQIEFLFPLQYAIKILNSPSLNWRPIFLQHWEFFLCGSTHIFSVFRCCDIFVFTCFRDSTWKFGPPCDLNKWQAYIRMRIMGTVILHFKFSTNIVLDLFSKYCVYLNLCFPQFILVHTA